MDLWEYFTNILNLKREKFSSEKFFPSQSVIVNIRRKDRKVRTRNKRVPYFDIMDNYYYVDVD